MNIITEPTVRLIGRTVLEDAAVDDYLESAGADPVAYQAARTDVSDGDYLPEFCGKLCYLSHGNPNGRSNREYLRHILEVGHGSVLEHANYTFLLSGVSRSLTHELVRHRAGFGFSEVSQRYVDSSGVAFVVPPQLTGEVAAARAYLGASHPDADCLDVAELLDAQDTVGPAPMTPEEAGVHAGITWLIAMTDALEQYGRMVEYLAAKLAAADLSPTDRRKAARQAARSVLPNATETKIVVTANARAWRHFIEQRCSRHADAEIRQLAVELWKVLRQEAPNTFGDYTPSPCPDGSVELLAEHRKV